MQQSDLIPHLFRSEYRKIVAVLCRRFGFEHMEVAEDIASDTFMAAVQSWSYKGVPPNPTAWLYFVAKNKARTWLHRKTFFDGKIAPAIQKETPEISTEEIDLSPQNINDSQLQMMFAVCHPAISPEAQIGLALRILCGFGIEEIADAFLTNKETINKRLFRAKEKLREERVSIEVPGPAEMTRRLENVLTTLYLLFSEGYYSESQNSTVRKELCLEAMRLCTMLVENESANKPQVNALLSLMCFHASRLDARINDKGELVLYDEQDTSLWDTGLISRGIYFFHRSAAGTELSRYHLEAGIAYWHTRREDTHEKWESILQLYNRLLQLAWSPIAALNRTYALYKANGRQEAIAAAEKLKLTDNHFYFVLLGELYSGTNRQKALENFQRALVLARTDNDRRAISRKLAAL